MRDLCNKTEARRSGATGADPATMGGAVHSLLFIEDDDQIRLALTMALEDEGYKVREAPDGRTGLAEFAEHEADLVLLDLRLPDMSGFDVCRALRARSIVPIIIITAQTDTHDLVAGLEAGADDYVTKPVVPKELAARIRALLRRVQLRETPAMKSAVFGDVELRREQGDRAQAGPGGAAHQDRVPADLRVRRPRRRGALPGPAARAGLGLRVPRRLPARRRPRPPPPGEDRGPARRASADRHRPRAGLPPARRERSVVWNRPDPAFPKRQNGLTPAGSADTHPTPWPGGRRRSSWRPPRRGSRRGRS